VSPKRRHDLAFALAFHRAECEFLTGDLTAAEEGLLQMICNGLMGQRGLPPVFANISSAKSRAPPWPTRAAGSDTRRLPDARRLVMSEPSANRGEWLAARETSATISRKPDCELVHTWNSKIYAYCMDGEHYEAAVGGSHRARWRKIALGGSGRAGRCGCGSSRGSPPELFHHALKSQANTSPEVR
jgi:hypothetical protein